MAPLISLIIVIIAYNIEVINNWTIPLAMLILFSILDIWLFKDYYKKVKLKNNNLK